jgi:hypothetical protein
LQKRQYDKAEREFRLIIENGDMDYVISHYNLGNILMEQYFDEGSSRYHDKAVIKEAIREARPATRKDFRPLYCVSDEENLFVRARSWYLLGRCLAVDKQYKEGMLYL